MENQTHFDLNPAIQQWRDNLGQSPQFRTENLDEMETHLRDSVAMLQGKGLSDEEAFLVATRRLGSETALGREFSKVNAREVWVNRGLWMLVGIQLWELIGSISGAFSRLTVAGLSVCGYQFDEAGRLLFGVPIPALPTALFILADLATISAITAGCWWLIQRNEKRLSFTLRRRGALIYGGIALCLTLLSVGLLNWLSFTVFNKLNEAKAASIMSMSAGMMVISFIKPIALVVLTVLIARRQIRLASVR